MNHRAVWAIYKVEMARTLRTIMQSVISPVISTSLYFVVFGAAIGSRITEVNGVSYGAFIVPGLIMLTLLTQSISNASFGIYFPKFVGTIFELLSAPVSYLEVVIAYVGAAATKSIGIGLIILATASLFVELDIQHPFWMLGFLDIVGGEDDGDAGFAQLPHQRPHVLAQFHVDAGGRLVEEQDFRLMRQRLADHHAALHAA